MSHTSLPGRKQCFSHFWKAHPNKYDPTQEDLTVSMYLLCLQLKSVGSNAAESADCLKSQKSFTVQSLAFVNLMSFCSLWALQSLQKHKLSDMWLK